MKKFRCWHFARNDMKLGYGDNRDIMPGEVLSVDCKPVLCRSGLHGSIDIMDALNYAQGHIICLVDIWGEVQQEDDKLCGTHREVIQMWDGEDILRYFAWWCALQSRSSWCVAMTVYAGMDAAESAVYAARYAARSADLWDAAWSAGAARSVGAARHAQRKRLLSVLPGQIGNET